ncbi:MAG: methyltransferase domain-containing protein [Bacteroidia bacterium]
MLRKTTLFLFFSFICLSGYTQKYRGEFAQQEFGLSVNRMNFFVDMFETKKQLTDFMEINPGEVIAEVGAGSGWNLGVLSTIYDSLTLYAEDVSTKELSQRKLQKTIAYYSKQRKTKQTNKFIRVIGSFSSTNLPDNTFDKILLIDAFHDFTQKDEMIEDIAKKLKPNGKIYILDGFSFPNDVQVCPDSKQTLTMLPVELMRFKSHGFYLTKMRGPDHRSHYGQGIVFERDKRKSEEFYKKKELIDPIVNRFYEVLRSEKVSDPVVMKGLSDSLLPSINSITEVYSEFEVWIKDLGLRRVRRKEFAAAINIFSALTQFFPESYQAYYWLGIAYEENKQPAEANRHFKLSLEKNPGNIKAKQKLKG